MIRIEKSFPSNQFINYYNKYKHLINDTTYLNLLSSKFYMQLDQVAKKANEFLVYNMDLKK